MQNCKTREWVLFNGYQEWCVGERILHLFIYLFIFGKKRELKILKFMYYLLQADASRLKPIAPILLSGLLKLINESEDLGMVPRINYGFKFEILYFVYLYLYLYY